MPKATYNEKNSTLVVTVEANKKDWIEKQEKAVVYLQSQQNIPGFRKGKAPAHLLKPVNRGEVVNRALNKIFPDVEKEALAEGRKKHTLIGQPKLNILKAEPEELLVEFIYPVLPKRFDLDYSKLNFKLKDKVVSKSDVEKAIKLSFRSMGLWKPATKISETSKVNISFNGIIDGKKFEGGDAEELEIELGQNNFLPEFETKLIGLKKDEKKKIKVKMPENYYRLNLNGKEAEFDVKVNDIQDLEFPKFDDNFVKSLKSPQYKTYDELFESFKEQTLQAELVHAKDKVVNDAIAKLAEKNTIPVPEPLLKQELASVNHIFDEKLKKSGFTRQEYIESSGYAADKLNKDLEEEASKNVQKRLVNSWLIEQLKIKVTDAEIEKYYKDLAKKYNLEDKIDEIKKAQPISYVKEIITTDKFFDVFLNELDAAGSKKIKENKLIVYK
ncbi:Trigger factor [Mycoplasmopsis californica]|uniref:Trigger factor n=1 Tax=Mycoplasmopsis equigenitalium TaxID=114883 RepID=A0ABY5J2S3_9BACT|nr:trigger factor [Mycoplasmopsis equigenitalium]UUD37068.1 trigger factor [Mycoplasmopsis equigenitalium]VEU69631.1 Trigger factor [Mycoplasmopsis californica]